MQSPVTFVELQKAQEQLAQYQSKYRLRLMGKNVVYIKLLLKFLTNIMQLVTIKPAVWLINDFIAQCKLQDVNLFSLIEYLDRSKLAYKLIQFNEK